MEDFDWIKKSDEEKKDKEDKYATEVKKVKEEKEETQVNEIPKEGIKERAKDEVSTVIEHRGESFDPFENFAVLALVDIAS